MEKPSTQPEFTPTFADFTASVPNEADFTAQIAEEGTHMRLIPVSGRVRHLLRAKDGNANPLTLELFDAQDMVKTLVVRGYRFFLVPHENHLGGLI